MSHCDLAEQQEFKRTSHDLYLCPALFLWCEFITAQPSLAALRLFKLRLVQFELCQFVTKLCTPSLGEASGAHWLMVPKCRLTSGWISASSPTDVTSDQPRTRSPDVCCSASTRTLCGDTWAQTGLRTSRHADGFWRNKVTSWMIERKIL